MKDVEIETKNGHHFFRTLFFIIILIIVLFIIYGKFLGNSGLIIKEYEITSKDIPSSFDNFKIVHFSDILYSKSEDINYFDDLIEKINAKKVDIIIFSGNLTNNYKLNEKEINEIRSKLSKLKAKYGKYYIIGIEDKDNPSYDSIMTNSNFISLNDNKDVIYSTSKEQILLLGIDSNGSTSFISDAIKESNVNYKIVIFNESDRIDEIKNFNFNLALSSNSLNGQINIPILKEFFLREGSEKYIEPYYKVNNTDLYISSGIGTDKINFRLFNKPSINLYKLKNM